MKKIIVLLLALCTTIVVNAQDKDSKDAVLEDITKDVCECVSDKVAEGIPRKEIEVQLGLCLINSYGKYRERIEKFMEIAFSDPESMEKFGQEIGMKMLTVCPDTFMAFAKDLIEEEVENYNPESETNSKVSTVSGEVVKLDNDQFNVLYFKGNNKRTYKLLWQEYFEGQELLLDFKSLKNKNIEVSFEDKEMYDPKLKDYRTYKVLRKIEIVN
ncbi:hypothetical protein [Kordia periserrulae]|nr:hypothetical protein [Kordia periserrulae]